MLKTVLCFGLGAAGVVVGLAGFAVFVYGAGAVTADIVNLA
jgi:hypothetical protein